MHWDHTCFTLDLWFHLGDLCEMAMIWPHIPCNNSLSTHIFTDLHISWSFEARIIVSKYLKQSVCQELHLVAVLAHPSASASVQITKPFPI